METLEGKVASYLAQHHEKKGSLAGKMGVTRTTFNRKLSGETEFLFSEAKCLADSIGINLDELYVLVNR